MKPSHAYYSGFCALLVAIAFAAGCAGTDTTAPGTNNSFELVAHTVSPPSNAPKECPLPILIFNNSQEITELHKGLIIAEPGEDPPAYGYPIPAGSVIYHAPGSITRIFDSSGKQILIVNDSVSSVITNAGYSAATTYFPNFSGNLIVIGKGEEIQYYINQSDQVHPCDLITVYADWVNPFRPSHYFLLDH